MANIADDPTADPSTARGVARLYGVFSFLQEYRKDARFMRELEALCEGYALDGTVERAWMILKAWLMVRVRFALWLWLRLRLPFPSEPWDAYESASARLFAQTPNAIPYGEYDTLPACAYRDALDEFVARWSLDRIQGGFGYQAIHDWVRDWHGLRDEGIADLLTDDEMVLGVALRFAYATTVYSSVADMSRGRWKLPTVNLRVSMEWDARRESARKNEKRIIAACKERIRHQQTQIRARYAAVGVYVGDTLHKRDLHYRWLYQHVAYGKDWRSLAINTERPSKDIAYDDRTIQKAVRRLADEIGVRIPNP